MTQTKNVPFRNRSKTKPLRLYSHYSGESTPPHLPVTTGKLTTDKFVC